MSEISAVFGSTPCVYLLRKQKNAFKDLQVLPNCSVFSAVGVVLKETKIKQEMPGGSRFLKVFDRQLYSVF